LGGFKRRKAMKIRFKNKKHSFTAPELINILEEHGYDNAGYMVDCIMLAAENLSQYNMPLIGQVLLVSCTNMYLLGI
jgi:hypothetical protein